MFLHPKDDLEVLEGSRQFLQQQHQQLEEKEQQRKDSEARGSDNTLPKRGKHLNWHQKYSPSTVPRVDKIECLDAFTRLKME